MGPLYGKVFRLAARRIFNAASLCVVRNTESASYLNRIGVDRADVYKRQLDESEIDSPVLFINADFIGSQRRDLSGAYERKCALQYDRLSHP